MRETFFQQGEESILGGIPSGICCIGYTDLEAFENDNFQLIYANEEFFQEIGYTREEFQIAGNDIRSIVTVAQREELRRQVREAMEGTVQAVLNYRVCNPRGNIFHVLLSVKALNMKDFYILMISCMRQDAFLEENMYRQEHQDQIRESVERLNRMVQKLPTGCAVLEGTQRWELVSGNEEFFRAIGYSEEELQVLPNDFSDVVYK